MESDAKSVSYVPVSSASRTDLVVEDIAVMAVLAGISIFGRPSLPARATENANEMQMDMP